ncbi:MAG: tetratricopeptide repeat protein [Terracidiphilus sp.]|nr:tetratricopeptide repeat protein [Terracidiphilus sp.]MDR3776003.1 tetratricopeptide repeat protein [Terracidiphilus sp.]
MRNPMQRCWLPALVIFAALSASCPSVLAQAAAPAAADAPPSPPQQQIAPLPVQASPEDLGDALMTHQRYQAALEAYKKATPSAYVWNMMGIAYQMMFNMQDAMRCYQASIKLAPRNAHVLNNLGTAYDSLKQFRAAERMYGKALKLDPRSALIYKNLGTNLLSQHKYKKGWEAYKTALSIDPQVFDRNGSPRAQNTASTQERGAMNFYMAKSCVHAGRNEQAIDYLRLALNEGFTTPKKIVADSEFASLRGIPAFEQLLAAQSAP